MNFGVSGVVAAVATLEISSAANANLGVLPLRFDTIRFLQTIGMAHFSDGYLEWWMATRFACGGIRWSNIAELSFKLPGCLRIN